MENFARDIEELSEHHELAPEGGKVSENATASSESETGPPEISPPGDEDAKPDLIEEPAYRTESVSEEISPEDLFEDVRRSLIEENERVEEKKKPGFWQRLRGGARKEKGPAKPDPEPNEPEISTVSEIVENDSVMETEEDADESIDVLIGMLEEDEEEIALEEESVPAAQVDSEAPKVEVEKVNINDLKKRAFQGSKPGVEENISDVRAVALEGGEEVFVEIEVKPEDPVEDRIKSFENALKPYRRYIYFGIAFIGIVVIIATSAIFYDVYERSLPPTPTRNVSNLPYPVTLNIPGLPSIILSRGTLDNGRWDPRRPEWLEGTEICRWVALPYSRQLEAVVRTLTREDQLELVMSNSDAWRYDVFSITQMTLEDMQEVSANSSCLLLVLADANTNTRWVVTAYP